MLTAVELVDARRHAGYPVLRSVPVVGSAAFALEAALSGLSSEEEDVVRGMLIKLNTLENDLFEIRDNSDTEQAAVFKRNANELGERETVYRSWRRRFAAFLGFALGDVAITPYPAVFVV